MIKIKETVTRFARNTSAHGIGRVAEEKAVWTRILWALIFVITFATCLYQLQVVIGIYLSYPVNAKNTVRLGIEQVQSDNKVVFIVELLILISINSSYFLIA